MMNYNHCQKYKANLKSTYFTQVCCHVKKFAGNRTVYDANFWHLINKECDLLGKIYL